VAPACRGHDAEAGPETGMRIVFVLSGLGAGGAEKIVNLLAHHRSSRGDDVHVLALNTENTASYFPYGDDIHLEAFGAGNRGWRQVVRIASRLRRLRRRLAEIKPDIVISFLTKINVQVGLVGAGPRVPLVLSERNNYRLQQLNPLWNLGGRIAMSRAARLVMQTEAACEHLSPKVRAKAVVIPNPIDATAPATPIPSSGNRIVAAGRLSPQKGFDLLLTAFTDVARRVPSAHLTIFGEGPERSALERQAVELGIAKRVQFPGVTSAPGEWISAADIFVLSSRFEGFPNVLLEALAAGLPSVAFDCPWGPADIVQDRKTGLLVPAENVPALADALVHLLTEPDVRSRIAVHARADTRFSTDTVLAKWDAVIDQVSAQDGKNPLTRPAA
jgi:glycosyltransferase involved in cell wall biosynthesis